jgi:sulfate transport system permease protein
VNAPVGTPSLLRGFGLSLGFSTLFLCAIVLIPLAALVMKTATMGWSDLVRVLLEPRAVASYKLSFGAALLAATLNCVFGFIIAWTLTRYEFPGRKLIDALIDMPFALPPVDSAIALTAVFAVNGGIGQYLAP